MKVEDRPKALNLIDAHPGRPRIISGSCTMKFATMPLRSSWNWSRGTCRTSGGKRGKTSNCSARARKRRSSKKPTGSTCVARSISSGSDRFSATSWRMPWPPVQEPVEIKVLCTRAEIDGQPAIRIAFRDNGPGLIAEQRQRIFEPFFTTKTKGTGLGMAIAKRIVEAHGGQIAVGSGSDRGAEILVTLPCKATMNQTLRIAIADDEPDMRDYFQQILPRLGHTVVGRRPRTAASWWSCAGPPSPTWSSPTSRCPRWTASTPRSRSIRNGRCRSFWSPPSTTPSLIERAETDHIMALSGQADQAGRPGAGHRASPCAASSNSRRLRQEASDLRQALADRKVIEKAKGILMKKAGLDEPEAFRRLQKTGLRQEPQAGRDRDHDPDGRRGLQLPVGLRTSLVIREHLWWDGDA